MTARRSRGMPSSRRARWGRSGKSFVSYTTNSAKSNPLTSREVGTDGNSANCSLNRATSWPRARPASTYRVTVLTARAERSSLDITSNFIFGLHFSAYTRRGEQARLVTSNSFTGAPPPPVADAPGSPSSSAALRPAHGLRQPVRKRHARLPAQHGPRPADVGGDPAQLARP